MNPSVITDIDSMFFRLYRQLLSSNESLYSSIDFLNTALGRLDIALFIHDLKKLRHTWTNKNYYNIIGYTEEEMKTLDTEWAKKHFHQDDIHVIQERIAYFRKNQGDTYTAIYRIRHKKGHWVWIFSKSTIYTRDKDGIPDQLIGIAVDLTAHMKTHQQFEGLVKENRQLKSEILICNLTKREKQVIRLICTGMKTTQVAAQLNLSVNTIHNHRKNVLKKLRLSSTTALVSFANENGLN